MLEKTYEPAAVEKRIFDAWIAAEAFKAGAGAKPGAEPFTIVIPPPNVTGSLHIGHALNNTVQDILVRFNRMLKKDVLWQPGMDHAGIATQMIVERQLMERQQPGRREMGREKFVERVWEWKGESGGTIMNQLKRLGASADFSRERFTMGAAGEPDDQMVRAVIKVFVELHKRGLIYRAKRLVNWHPGLETAISDLEVENIEVKGHMWHLRYPLADGVTYEFPVNDEEGNVTGTETRDYIIVATTRPETMLGDVAVAVHPEDERYAGLVGKFIELPLVGRRIPVVADEYADPTLGTGAVKITPAHDFNDFEVGVRAGVEPINVFTTRGAIIDADFVPAKYRGMDRFDARKAIVADLSALAEENPTRGLDHIEDKKIMVPHDEKSKLVVIEPFLTDQWWVKADVLAQPALASVREGRTKFVPQQYENTYFAWLENIKPWCISRQLWWGHQIPAWYGPDGKVFVAETEDEAIGKALGYYVEQEVITPEQGDAMANDPAKREGFITRDEDVLDTWFSSALWPFSTLGWPDTDIDVKRYYPTNVLVTGFDIIFFWVARMMMMGLHFMKDVPFPTVYIHALVRDEKGAKMSKSKGNVIDPLHLIDDYGADALRFTLAAMAAQGRDIKLSTQRVEGYRNFATKLWNASRFAEMNGCALAPGFNPEQAKETLNRWIAHETAQATREVTEAIEAYRFNDAAGAIYRFVWNVYCDWYLELAKPVLTGPDNAAKSETQASVAWARDEILKLLHPFMPFITEELWATTAQRTGMLALAEWPLPAATIIDPVVQAAMAGDPLAIPVLLPPVVETFSDPAAEAEIGWLIDLVTAIRSVRSEMNIPPATLFPLTLVNAPPETRERARRWSDVIKRLARVADITFADAPPQGSLQLLVRGEIAAIPLKGVVDLGAERARLDKEIAKADADIKRVDAKLGNADFVARAPEEVIDEQREKREEAQARRAKLVEALDRLKDVE